jgi:hypothetical protein
MDINPVRIHKKNPGRGSRFNKHGFGTQQSRIALFFYKIFLRKSVKYAEGGAFLMSWGWCWASRSFSPRLCCPEKSSSSDDPNYRKKMLWL